MPDRTIAHISDTHLGYRAYFRAGPDGRNLRSIDVEDAYRAVVDDVIRHGGFDLIVHSGDVFHQSRPSWSAIRCFIEQTRRLEQLGVPIIVIAGNHDTAQLRTANTVFSVLELALPNVCFVSGYEERIFDLESLGLNVVAVPHGRLSGGPLSDIPLRPDRQNMLVTHGLAPTLAESPRHEIGETVLDQNLLSRGFDLILLGHFHTRVQVNGNTWYAGSSERIGWNDEQTRPGWSVIHLSDDGSVTQSERLVHSRQMITLGAYDGDGQTARQIADGVLERAEAFAQPDAVVRIELMNVDRTERRSAESMIRREAAGKFLVLQTYSRQDNTALFNEDVRIDDSLRMKGLTDLFTDFCAEQPYDDGFRARFLERGRTALETAIRAAESSAGDDA
jgi:DNA repair exonuclease SbcCD nuclease subunit